MRIGWFAGEPESVRNVLQEWNASNMRGPGAGLLAQVAVKAVVLKLCVYQNHVVGLIKCKLLGPAPQPPPQFLIP